MATASIAAAALILLSSSASADAWVNIENKILDIVCQLETVFASAATGVAALVMVMAAIQWVASESDAGARKKAKTTMVQAIVGLIIVLIANDIAGLVLPVNC